MGISEIREPIQKRSIEKKEKIIHSGFELICEKGYYNTNTAEIAKLAGVSTGIVYQYFKDKHDILIEGIKLYANSIFFPMLAVSNTDVKITANNFPSISMTHSDKEVAKLFHNAEMEITTSVTSILLKNGFKTENINEKVHIAIGMIDNLCHEIVYHKHEQLDYNKMIEFVISTITNLLK